MRPQIVYSPFYNFIGYGMSATRAGSPEQVFKGEIIYIIKGGCLENPSEYRVY